jgi:trimeric autotransporter adhesin
VGCESCAECAVATPISQAFCSGESTNIALTTSPSLGSVSFTWTVPVGTNNIFGQFGSSGNNISQTLFNEDGSNSETITYTIIPTRAGCSGTPITVPITVHPIPVATATPGSQSVCNGQTTSINLTSPVSGTNFNWTVTGPPAAGGFTNAAGTQINQTLTNSSSSPVAVTYTVTPSTANCTGSPITVQITVNPTPAVTFNSFGGPYCISDNSPISLIPFGIPAGGTFSGPGVAGNDFVPALAAVGTNTITYSFSDINGCPNTATTTVQVTGLPLVSFSGLSVSGYCVNDNSPVTLTGFPAAPGTGVFSGPGISGNTFTPSVAGVGLHAITYTYTDANGCVGSQTQSVNVFALPNLGIFDLATSYCIDDAPVTASGFPPGGTFSGPGITGAGVFTPSAATVGGPYTITYQFTDGNGCTNTTTATTVVHPLPTVSFSGLAADYCIDAASVTLSGSPAGGTFTGPGMTTGGVFTPSVAGLGTHSITYTYTDGNGCTNFQTQTVEVTGIPGVTFSGLDPAYCIDAASVTLTGNNAPDGTFSGPGITDNGNGTATFNPANAGVGGPYNITYSFTNPLGCGFAETQQVVVNPLPDLSFTGLAAAYCVDAPSVTLTGSFAPGGSFSGGGITDNGNGTATFSPSAAGSGPASITYEFTNANGCFNTNTQGTTVNAIPTVSYTGFGDVCVDQPAQPLTGSPTGGVFSGAGISGNQFFPAITGVGTFPVTYTFVDGNGCDDTFTENFTVHNIPVVTVNPASVQVCPGDAVTFLVSATGIGLSYQWQVNTGSGFVNLNNGGIYSGVNTQFLNVGPIAQSLNGFQYRVLITGSTCGTQVFSNSAAINISSSPVVDVQPADQFVCDGDDAQFSVSATGSGLTYQWQVNTGSGWTALTNDAIYSGVTTNTLTVSGYDASMDGDLFRVVISGSSNCTSSTTSQVASLNGSSSPVILIQPTDQSVCEGSNTVFAVSGGGSGLIYQWQVNDGGGWVNVTDGGIYSGSGTDALSLTGITAAEDGYQYRVNISNASCPGSSLSDEVTLTITTSPAIAQQPDNAQVCPGDDASFTVVADGSGNTYQWQINTGSGFTNVTNGGPYSGATTTTLAVNGVNAGMDGHQFRVIVQNSQCASASTSTVATLSQSVAPIIAMQPADGYFCVGDDVTFTAMANGSSLTYQWQVNTGSGWVNVANNATYSGANTTSLTVAGTTSAMNGHRFRLIVAGSVNCSGTALTAVVELIETNEPLILNQPLNQGVCENSGASFTVNVPGNVTYQWQLNSGSGFTDITDGGIYSGATTATLSLNAVALADDGNQYRVVVSGVNCTGDATSQVATLTITDEPVIVSQSPDQYVCTGDDAVFAVSVDGTGLNYQWQEDDGTGFTDIVDGGDYSGANTAVLTIQGATPSYNGFGYRVIVESGNCVGAATSEVAFLFENAGPVVLVEPNNAQVCPNDNAVFSVSAGGTSLTYQWQVNTGSGFTNLNDNNIYSGTTTSSLLVQGATTAMNNHQFRAIIEGSVNCAVDAVSDYGVLTVSPNPTITQQPADLSFCDGDNASLTIAANGAQGYQWQENTGAGWVNLSNGGIYAGVNTPTLSLSGIPAANDGFQYRVVVSGSSNCQGTATSTAVTITEDPNPFIAQQPADQFVCPGDAAAFTIAATGSGLIYQWQEDAGLGFVDITDGGVYSGATTATLNISDGTGLDGYQYRAIITGSICTGSSTTNEVTLNETNEPAILDQPDDIFACPGDNVSLAVSAGGSGLTYQWQVNTGSGFVDVTNGVLYNGATTAVLSINGVTPGMNGNLYQVIISSANCAGSSTSVSASLNISTSPTIVAQPVNDAVCSGQDASFTFSATGPNLTYQWQVNDGSGFVNIFNNNTYSGATTTTLNISNATFAMNGYTYRAIVTGSVNCPQTATTSVVTLSVTQQPVANAGTGGNSCNFDFTFNAVPSAGTGTWSQLSGTGTSTFSNANSATATATATLEGTYVYQWEEVNGACSDLASVTVNFFNQPVANAGPDANECDLDHTFSGTASFGTGTWTQFNGPGTSTFVDANSATSDVTVTTYGTYTFRWTEVNGTCSDFDDVTVNFFQQPVANAGVGGNECDLNFVFNAQPSVGSGVWTAIGPGTATFNNAGSNVATVTVSQYGSYTFTWTETNGTCVDSDDVVVNFFEQPAANAGSGGSVCGLDFVFNATLTTGIGQWTQTSGPGTSTFGSASSPSSTVSVSQVGTYVFTWTETTGVCVSSASVTVNFFHIPVADAGNGGDECDLDFALNAQPSEGIGTWTQTLGPGFSNFVPNANSPNATVQVSAYGTYEFTWREVDGGICISQDVITVNFYEQPVADAGSDDSSCDLTFTMAAVASAGSGTWTQVSGPGTSVFANPNSPTTGVSVDLYGEYVYQWEEIEGTCSDADLVTVNYYEQPVSDAGFGGFECDFDFQLSANPSVGVGSWAAVAGPPTATVTFSSIGDPNAIATVNQLGQYTFTWTEVNGTCSSSDNVVVTFEQQTNADAGQGGDECDLDFTFNGTPSFGTGIWTYTGPGTALFTDDNSVTSTVTVTQFGTYTFTWTETFGTCITTDQVTVNFYQQPVANAGQGGDACSLVYPFNGAISTPNGSGTWTQVSGPGTASFSDATSPTATATVDQYGTYSFQWEEVNGTCSDNATVTVNFYPQPVADAGQGGSECDLDFDFNGTLSTVGGTGVWTLTNGFGTPTFVDATDPATSVSVSAYGSYQFTWTETNGSCTDAANVTVNFFEQPVADAGLGDDVCTLTYQLQANPSVGAGQWTQASGPGTSTFTNAASAFSSVTVSQAGTYVFTWTESTGAGTCTSSDDVTVNFFGQPAANAGQGGNECDLDFDLAAIPNLGTGVWTQSSGPGTSVFGDATSASTNVTVDLYGTYTYTWSETEGVCVSTDVITVNYYEQPVANAGQGGSECDLNFNLNATSSVAVATGQWTQTSGPGFSSFSPNAGTGNAVVTVNTPGQYVYTWTETNGTCSDNGTVTVDFFQQPVANAGAVSNQCDLDITLAAVPSAGVGTWTVTGPGNGSFSDENAPNATLTVDQFGTYNLTWTEVNGTCSDAASVTVTFNDLPVVSFSGLAATYCIDQTALVPLSGSPAGGVFSGQGMTGANFIPSAAGVGIFDITYTYTDGNSCTNSETQSVEVRPLPTPTFTGLGQAYCVSDQTPVALAATPAGGTFTGPGMAGEAFTAANAGAGTHTITYTFTDGFGCTGVTTQTVTVNPLPVVSFTGLANEYCEDVSLVTLTGTPAGGTFAGPGISGNVFNPTQAGSGSHVVSYTFTDSNGCTNTATQNVNVNTLPAPIITPNGTVEICAGSFVVLNAGSGYFQYQWNNNESGQTLLVNQAGTYNVTVTSQNGCQALSEDVEVIVNAVPVVDLGEDQTICTGTFATLDAGNPGMTYAWTPTQEVTQQITVGTAGTYTVTVTDANGCSTTDAVSVSISNVLTPAITANGSTTICQGQTLTLNAGSGYTSYLWSNGSQSQFIDVTAGGTYDVNVSNVDGCAGSASINITVNQLPNAVVTASGSTNLCPGASVVLTASNTFATYVWNLGNQTTPSITVTQAGSYTVTVTDPVNGCSATSQPVNVTQAQTVQPTIVANGPLSFCQGGSVVLSVSPTGAFNSFLWTTGSTTSSITVNSSSEVGVSVIDANNCLIETLLATPTVVTVWNPQPIVGQQGGTLFVTNGPFSSYQWFRNGQPVPGATQDSYDPTQSGNFVVQVTDENDCSGTSSNTEFTFGVGIGDVRDVYDLKVYPNPNDGLFVLEAELGNHTDVTLTVRDMLGRELIPAERIQGTSSFRRSFDLGHLANGMYFVQVMGRDGVTVKQVIKQ